MSYFEALDPIRRIHRIHGPQSADYGLGSIRGIRGSDYGLQTLTISHQWEQVAKYMVEF